MAPQGDFGPGATFMPRTLTVSTLTDGTVAETATLVGDLTTASGQHGLSHSYELELSADERSTLQGALNRLVGAVQSAEGVGAYVPPPQTPAAPVETPAAV